MTNAPWYTQYTDCLRSRGMIISVYQNPTNQEIAKKLMTMYGVSSIFLGIQKNVENGKWIPDIYFEADMDYEFVDDQTNLYVDDYVIIATLEGENFTFQPIYGNYSDNQAASAICEYGESFFKKYWFFLLTLHFFSFKSWNNTFYKLGNNFQCL